MIWQLRHHGAVVASGTYSQMIETAEEWQVIERGYHLDGTELAPRWLERGYSIEPEITVSVRRAAA